MAERRNRTVGGLRPMLAARRGPRPRTAPRIPEAVWFKSCGHGGLFQCGVEVLLQLRLANLPTSRLSLTTPGGPVGGVHSTKGSDLGANQHPHD